MVGQLTGFQQVVLGATGVLVALRLFFPILSDRVHNGVGETLLQVLALFILAAVVMFLGPSVWATVQRSKRPLEARVAVLLVTVLLITLRLQYPVQFAPRFTIGERLFFLATTSRDRVMLTLGVWSGNAGYYAPPDWLTTGVHVGLFALAGVLWAKRIGRVSVA